MSEKREDIRKEIQAEAPILSGLKTKEIKASSAYFDSLAKKIINEIVAENVPIVKLEKSPSVVGLAIAASIALVMGLAIFSWSADQASTFSAEVTVKYLEETFLEEHLLAIEDDLFYEIILDESEELVEREEDAEDPRIEFLLDSDIDIEELLIDYTL